MLTLFGKGLLLVVWGGVFVFLGERGLFVFFLYFFSHYRASISITKSQFFEKKKKNNKCLSSTLDIQTKNSVKSTKPVTCVKKQTSIYGDWYLGLPFLSVIKTNECKYQKRSFT